MIKKLAALSLLILALSCNKPEIQYAKACFNYSPDTSIYIGDTITFLNCSEKASTYSWDFGDGTTSTLINPEHQYAESGTFSVELTAENESSTDSLIRTITVMKEILFAKACFNYTPDTSIYVGDTSTFLNCSENASTYSWDFGDGVNSTVTNPQHQFLESGTFSVELTAENEQSTNSKVRNVRVYPDPIPETVYPLPYFPAYPGSYWIYQNNLTLRVADQYEEYIFNKNSYDDVPDYDTLLLPKLIANGIFNGPDSFAYVKEYSISKAKNSGYRDPAFYGILSEEEGARFPITGSFGGYQTIGKTIKVDTTITVNDVEFQHVIIVIRYDAACPMSNEVCATQKEYYARDVGLIRRENREYPNGMVTTLELVDYKINK